MRLPATLLAAAVATAIIGVPALPASAGTASEPPIVLNGSGPTPIPLKNMAMIIDTEWGPRYVAGQQNSKLTVTVSGTDTITFRDRGTRAWKVGSAYMPDHCTKQHVKRGVKATCTILPEFQNGMFVQIWPRLGNDQIDGSTLPSWVRFWVLTDKGDDTVLAGAGDDFVNGGQGADTVHGGDGADWIRTGLEGDVIYGDGGDDLLIGVDGGDEIHGGTGTDKLGGGPGNDKLWGDEGDDSLICQNGDDTAHFDSSDVKLYLCETRIQDPAQP
jgi:serralysin